MSRRSLRLLSKGYYNNDGQPAISYKETLHRVFKLRRNCSLPSRVDSNSDSTSDENSNEHSTRTCRGPRISSLKISGFLFFILPLCFAFAYLSLLRSSNFLDSGPPESPDSSTITIMNFNSGFAEMAQHIRELQDELLRLNKMIKHRIPPVDTLPNFALESLGASVLFQLSSKTYLTREAGLTFFGLHIWRPSVSPRTVIQGHSPLVPGSCWAFAGGRGHLVIALSHPVHISQVTLGHISKNLSPTGTILSAPKEFSVYGMETLDDEGSQLGTFLYDQDGDSVQTFKLAEHTKGVFNYVRLQVESNWGNPEYSCLYSFRVNGKLAEGW